MAAAAAAADPGPTDSEFREEGEFEFSPKGRRRQIMALALGTLVYWIVIGLTAAYIYEPIIRGLLAQNQFETAAGKINESRLHDPGEGQSQRLRVKYEFHVSDRRHEGDRYRLAPGEIGPAKAERLAKQLTPGSAVEVFFDPENPSRNALDLSLPLNLKMAGLFMPLFLLYGLLLIAKTVRRARGD